ncbi:hypothetical protein [Metasolibacillus meyeri]|uniref:hypothetical protein n=1 Tax=Metasolibacillus meyeri TaxID=1071052 RepID=UPI000D2FEA38|nr:hypothetical protein [Metasolibacillus meyeri]
MTRLKSIRISAINWNTQFDDANGSYYDYVASLYSNDKESHASITQELLGKGWRIVENSDSSLSILEKDRHIIRLSKLWGETND